MKFIKDHLLHHKAKSREHFFKLLMDNGFAVTYERGTPIGIKDTNGKKYTWQKLGIQTQDFYQLDQRARFLGIDERLRKLEQIRDDKQPDKSIER